jgi:hypothetical protein
MTDIAGEESWGRIMVDVGAAGGERLWKNNG